MVLNARWPAALAVAAHVTAAPACALNGIRIESRGRDGGLVLGRRSGRDGHGAEGEGEGCEGLEEHCTLLRCELR